MVKRWLLLFFAIFFFLALPVHAQWIEQGNRKTVFRLEISTVGGLQVIPLDDIDSTAHQFVFYPVTTEAASRTITIAGDDGGGYSTITTSTTTEAHAVNFSGAYRSLRVTLTAESGGSGIKGTYSAGGGIVSSIIPGTGATNLGKAIDTATGATDTGVLVLATRDDALTTLTPIDGDNVQLRTTSTGALWTSVSNLTVDTADDAPATENSVLVGCKNETTPTTIEDLDKGTLHCDTSQRLIVAGAGSAGTPAGGLLSVQGVSGGTALRVSQVDPCSSGTKVFVPIDIVTATTTEVINQSASNYAYICSIILFTDAANDVSLVEDDTDACASPTAGIMGGVTAAEGFNFGATQGFGVAGGNSTIAKTAAADRNVCIITSAATQLNGTISYVLAP